MVGEESRPPMTSKSRQHPARPRVVRFAGFVVARAFLMQSAFGTALMAVTIHMAWRYPAPGVPPPDFSVPAALATLGIATLLALWGCHQCHGEIEREPLAGASPPARARLILLDDAGWAFSMLGLLGWLVALEPEPPMVPSYFSTFAGACYLLVMLMPPRALLDED